MKNNSVATMIVRVNVKTDAMPETYLVDMDELPEGDTKTAIKHALSEEDRSITTIVDTNILREASVEENVPEVAAIASY